MPNLDDLRRARATAAQAMATAADALTALEASAAPDAAALTAATAAFDQAEAAFKAANVQVQRAESVEAAQAAAAGTGDTRSGAAPVPAAPHEKGLGFAKILRTLAAANGNVYLANQIAETNGDSGLFANQNMATGAAGGFLVPEAVSGEVIELLRPASVVSAMGPRFIPMPNGNLTTNRRATGASFSYGGEQQDIDVTGITLGQVRLSAKKLSGLIPISNDLLRSSGTAIDRLVRDDAVADAALMQDRYFLRGLGTEYAPRGLRYQNVGTSYETTHILTMTATPDLAKVTTDLGRMELALANANVVVTGAHWAMSPRTQMYLQNLRDGNGNYAFPEVANGQLRRKPIHVTTQIPQNLGGGTESEILLVAPEHVMIGEHMGIEIAMSTEAAYVDGTSTLVSAFSRDETLMRMILQHDIGLRHLAAVAVLTGVTWGV